MWTYISGKTVTMAAAVLVVCLMLGGMIEREVQSPQQHVETNAKPRAIAVESELRIGDSETVRVLVVPSPLFPGERMMDSQCLVYVNTELGQSQVYCLPRMSGGR
jgi:hypothetical protein